MREVRFTTQLKKDLKRVEKRGKDLDKLKEVVASLASGERLAERLRDHALAGRLRGFRECHVEPDWLLVYALTDDELTLVRTGSHSDLFQK